MNSGDVAVRIRGLSKAYTIAHESARHTTMAEALVSRLRNPMAKPRTETFWALKGIDLDIQRGEVAGIIGRNGAGKTTLLKVLSRITEPTDGRVDIYGRVGSLLEVGTGFHPELTGRENIYLNGAILGMRKAEIKRQFDAIVDFSAIERFLDTPVKRYSSGMYVRLAFAVAAHLSSEILIVDEVLAVGDIEFQQKCLGKMSDVASCGRTVLVVSHNMRVVSQLCKRAVFMQGGVVTYQGDTAEAIKLYLGSAGMTDAAVSDLTKLDPAQRRGTGLCRFSRIELINAEGARANVLRWGEPLTVQIEVESSEAIENVLLSFSFVNREGLEILGTSAHDGGVNPCDIRPGRQTFECRVNPQVLLPGPYAIRATVFKRTDMYDQVDEAIRVSVSDAPWKPEAAPANHCVGLVHVPYTWSRVG